MQMPLSFVFFPLRKNPFCASKRISLKPTFSMYSSVFPASVFHIATFKVYNCGFSTDHNFGFCISQSNGICLVELASTEKWFSTRYTSLPARLKLHSTITSLGADDVL